MSLLLPVSLIITRALLRRPVMVIYLWL